MGLLLKNNLIEVKQGVVTLICGENFWASYDHPVLIAQEPAHLYWYVKFHHYLIAFGPSAIDSTVAVRPRIARNRLPVYADLDLTCPARDPQAQCEAKRHLRIHAQRHFAALQIEGRLLHSNSVVIKAKCGVTRLK
jgi:hypothetical protein